MNHAPPAHVLADLDQAHAADAKALDDLLDALVADGIAEFDAGCRTVGVALELRDLDHPDLLQVATAALARLLDQITNQCSRCDATGTVYVTTYGGHTVPCGLCRGTGKASES